MSANGVSGMEPTIGATSGSALDYALKLVSTTASEAGARAAILTKADTAGAGAGAVLDGLLANDVPGAEIVTARLVWALRACTEIWPRPMCRAP